MWAPRDQIDRRRGIIEVRRLKGSVGSVQPLQAFELRLFTELHHVSGASAFLFISERGAPISRRTAQYIVAAAGLKAKVAFPVNAHMLRHAAGYKLANDGASRRDIQAWLGHQNLNNVTCYTVLSAERLARVWRIAK